MMARGLSRRLYLAVVSAPRRFAVCAYVEVRVKCISLPGYTTKCRKYNRDPFRTNCFSNHGR